MKYDSETGQHNSCHLIGGLPDKGIAFLLSYPELSLELLDHAAFCRPCGQRIEEVIAQDLEPRLSFGPEEAIPLLEQRIADLYRSLPAEKKEEMAGLLSRIDSHIQGQAGRWALGLTAEGAAEAGRGPGAGVGSKATGHPSGDEALRFLAGVMPEADRAGVETHIQSGCRECKPLFNIPRLREQARELIRTGARLLRVPLNLPAPTLAFTVKDEPPELYRESVEASSLIIVAEQDGDELLVRIRAADASASFRSVYVAILSAAGNVEAILPWHAGLYWPAQYRFPNFNCLAETGGSVNLVVSPIPPGADPHAEGGK